MPRITEHQPDNFALRDLENSEMDEKFAQLIFQQFPTPDDDETTVVVHQNSRISSGVQFGERAGPVGNNSRISEGGVILGALYQRIQLQRNVVIGRRARLGTIAESELLGDIVIGQMAQIGATVRIFSPEKDHATSIGAGSIIGDGTVIGRGSKPMKTGSPLRAAQGREVVIEDDVKIAGQTIILPGVYIGEDSTIGKGYKLAEDLELPPHTHIQDDPDFSGQLSPQRTLVTPDWIKKHPSLVTTIS